jgi:hypothetical protein
MSRALLFLAVFAGSASAAGPGDAVAQALADCKALPTDRQQQARYLSLYAIPEKDRPKWEKVLVFHVNSLSREPELAVPVKVAPDLLRVYLDDYQWDRKVWERLLDAPDPYYHALVEQTVVVQQEYGYFAGPGKSSWVTTRVVPEKQKKRVQASAPWLPALEIAALIALTQSQIPLVRADWFLFQTAIQKDRKAGYYDFLKLGNKEKDFQELVGADARLAQKLRKEIAGIVARSSVTLNNRSLIVERSVTGFYAFTFDFASNVDVKNPVRLLDRDARPDASEQYGTLPNGLLATWLQNGQGIRQDTAPDNIASDGKATGSDRRVHVGLSCWRCHGEALQPVNDWARRIYQPPLRLDSPIEDAKRKLRALYLSDLAGAIDDANRDFAKVLLRVNGWKPRENARAYADAWDWYAERDRTVDDAASELGVAAEAFKDKLRARARMAGSLDPILGALLQGLPVRVEHWEEIFAVAMDIARAP